MREAFPDAGSVRAREALPALAACAARTTLLVARRRVLQPTTSVGRVIGFVDGTSARVYRETVIERSSSPALPTVLVVGFRLRRIRSDPAHALFRMESELNTILFAGFPGLVSKLWLEHDQRGRYRGVYQWDGPDLARSYVRTLAWVLDAVSVPGSVDHVVLPGLWRDAVLADPGAVAPVAAAEGARGAWWWPRAAVPAPAGAATTPSELATPT